MLDQLLFVRLGFKGGSGIERGLWSQGSGFRRLGVLRSCFGLRIWQMLGEEAIELVGKFGAVAVAEGWRATADDGVGAAAQGFHEVSHGEAFADVFVGEFFAAMGEDVAAFFEGLGGEGDVGGDGEVSGVDQLDDFVVGFVKAARHDDHVDVAGHLN